MRTRLRHRRERERSRSERGRFCEDRIYSGPFRFARCVHYATGYQQFNDIYLCGLHAKGYLSVEPLVSIAATR